MKKLKLNPDDLRVESFAPSRAPAGAGTVRAYLTQYVDVGCDTGAHGICQHDFNSPGCEGGDGGTGDPCTGNPDYTC